MRTAYVHESQVSTDTLPVGVRRSLVEQVDRQRTATRDYIDALLEDTSDGHDDTLRVLSADLRRLSINRQRLLEASYPMLSDIATELSLTWRGDDDAGGVVRQDDGNAHDGLLGS